MTSSSSDEDDFKTCGRESSGISGLVGGFEETVALRLSGSRNRILCIWKQYILLSETATKYPVSGTSVDRPLG